MDLDWHWTAGTAAPTIACYFTCWVGGVPFRFVHCFRRLVGWLVGWLLVVGCWLVVVGRQVYRWLNVLHVYTYRRVAAGGRNLKHTAETDAVSELSRKSHLGSTTSTTTATMSAGSLCVIQPAPNRSTP